MADKRFDVTLSLSAVEARPKKKIAFFDGDILYSDVPFSGIVLLEQVLLEAMMRANTEGKDVPKGKPDSKRLTTTLVFDIKEISGEGHDEFCTSTFVYSNLTIDGFEFIERLLIESMMKLNSLGAESTTAGDIGDTTKKD